ncbi:MAG: DNA helicase II [Gammaproteobacteria bacterium]|nr:DNA helicase II [Gammaproteobacteria bacterium]
MDVSHLFNELNETQREAVSAGPGPLLVLAGAGSGKTRVLTHRVAWLVQALSVSPLSILAVTFTNKAANEMRGRIEQMLGYPVRGMWMGTFHGLSHRLLRTHWQEAGLKQSFDILDSDDQLRVIRRVLKDLDLDEGYWPPRQVQWFINGHKEEGRRTEHLPQQHDVQQVQMQRVYKAYEEACRRFGVVDFGELLLRAFELLQNHEPLREHYQRRFQHVLVDEFQDTNSIQYRWLNVLAEAHNNIVAVGDDDQSIYGWRGARVENILRFESDYPGTRVVRLEQNYRSTSMILNAANAVIDHNQSRLGKKLWTDGEAGEKIKLYTAFNEVDEARFVVDRAQAWVGTGQPRQSIAILYRSNAQSRVFEEILLDMGIPYRVYGGLRFFERSEIKDALAYLRLLADRESDPAFERVVNVPSRGIGNRTLDAIRGHARHSEQSLWAAGLSLCTGGGLSARATTAVTQFMQLIDELDRKSAHLSLSERTNVVIRRSGLIEHFRKEKGEKGEARIENLEELVNAAGNFNHDADEGVDELLSFLSHAALEAGEGQAEDWEDCVQLMSLHSAKGLEFPLVFLCGLEEGLFPHQRSLQEPGRLEEERRLCYVGMTRAMRSLYVTYAESRRLHGRDLYTSPSRFLREIPSELVEEVRSAVLTRPLPAMLANQSPVGSGSAAMKLGARVRHAKFGDGMVLNLEGQGGHARVQVNFERAGSKWLVLAYANLETI